MEEINKPDTKKRLFSSPLAIAVAGVVALIVLLLLVIILKQGQQLRTTITDGTTTTASPQPSDDSLEALIASLAPSTPPEPPSNIIISIRALEPNVEEGNPYPFIASYTTSGAEAFDPSSTDVLINYAGFDFTADLGEDYLLPLAAQNQVTIPAGQRSAIFNIQTVNDEVPEPTEKFKIVFDWYYNVEQSPVAFVDTATGNSTNIYDLYRSLEFTLDTSSAFGDIYDDDENLHYVVRMDEARPYEVLEGDSPRDNKRLVFRAVLRDQDNNPVRASELVDGPPPGMTASTNPNDRFNNNNTQYTPLDAVPVTFRGNQSEVRLIVPITSDTHFDTWQRLTVLVSLRKSNGRLIDQGIGLIIDDDILVASPLILPSPSPTPQTSPQ